MLRLTRVAAVSGLIVQADAASRRGLTQVLACDGFDMSYEYLLVGAPKGGASAPSFEDVDTTVPIGSMSEVKLAIEGVFPRTVWKERSAAPMGVVLFGSGGPEFQFHAEGSGFVTSIMMSRATLEDVRRLLPVVGCLAMDLQEETIISAGPRA